MIFSLQNSKILEIIFKFPLFGIKSEHRKQKCPCIHCGYNISTNPTLDDHVKLVHLGVKYECPNCDYKVEQNLQVNSHTFAEYQVETFTCLSCEYKARSEILLSWQKYILHGNYGFHCTLCG